MKLENEFTIDAPVEEAWNVLLDLDRITPCLPGAELKEETGDGEHKGTMRVKFGPVTQDYEGTVWFEETDESQHRAVLRADGQDARGQGTASATITSTLQEENGGESTRVRVETDMQITGRAAQFGRGMHQDVATKIMGRFAECLENEIMGGGVEEEPERPAASEVQPSAEDSAKESLVPHPPRAHLYTAQPSAGDSTKESIKVLSLGIDFGTTNSAMAWYNPDTEQAEIILNAEGEDKTPSLVYFGEGEILVGKPVEDLLEDSEHYEEAERADITQRIVKGIKRNLIDPPVIPIPGREPVRPVEVVARILGKLKHDAEKEYFQEEVHQAVIACPAVFGDQQRKVIFDAATLAGFKVVDLVEEPVAAAMAFARLGRKVGRGVLVYDLGGGTFDLALLARDEEEDIFRVAMEPDGDPRCGGDDFDQTLYDYCERLARQELGRSIGEVEGAVNPYFLNECRKQKQRLTAKEQVAVRDYLDGELFRAQIDRETFEGLIGDQVEKTVRKTASMVERAKGQGLEVDTVVLIGGSSRVPLVDRRLRETLEAEPQKFVKKDYAVALGAAYHASVLELSAREQYRRALEISWADQELNREEVEHLSGLAKDLELSGEEAAEIEREVMGAVLEDILDGRREEYRKAVEESWEVLRRLETLPERLGLGAKQTEKIERQVTGNSLRAILERQQAENLYERGRALRKQGRYEEAIEAFDQALKIKPHHFYVWCNKVLTLFLLGRPQEVVETLGGALLRILRVDPANPYARIIKGVIWSFLRCPEEAVEAFDQALRIDPDNPYARVLKGVTLADELKRQELMIEDFERRPTIYPDNPYAWILESLLVGELGHSEEVIEGFEQAPTIYPDNPHAWIIKGVTLSLSKRPEEAIEALDQALSIDPDNPHAWIIKGVTLSLSKRPEEAIEAFDEVLRIEPDYSLAWFIKGMELGELKRHEEMIDALGGALRRALRGEAFLRTLRIDSGSPYAWIIEGAALSLLRRPEEAMEALDQTLSLDPDNPYAWIIKGVALGELERYEEVVEALLRALSIDPDNLYAWIIRGMTLFLLGRPEEAMEAYDQVIRIKPDYSLAWLIKGMALEALRRYEEAIEACDQALSLNPDYSLAWDKKGSALYNLGRYEEALEAFDRTLRLKPKYSEAWNEKGQALSKLDRNQEALEAYDQAVRIKPNHSLAWYNKGVALDELGRNQEALEVFDGAIRIKPNYAEAWKYKGVALFNLGRNQEAIEAYDRAISIDPNDAAAWNYKGVALGNQGRKQEALEAYDRAISIDPNDTAGWNNKGVELGNQGRNQEALEACDQATRIKPDYHYVWNEKGVALYNQGRHEEAIEAYDRAISIDPNDAAIWYNKGQALRALGRNQEALEAYDRAIKIKPDNADAWNNKGVVLRALGRNQEALEAYDRAIRINPNHPNARSNKNLALANAPKKSWWRR